MIMQLDRHSGDYWPCMCAGLSRLSREQLAAAMVLWEKHFQETPWSEMLLENLLPLGGLWLAPWAYLGQGPWLSAKEKLYRMTYQERYGY